MRYSFYIGDYKYSRKPKTLSMKSTYQSWSAGATRPYTWSKPTGYDYVTDNANEIYVHIETTQSGNNKTISRSFSFNGGVQKTVTVPSFAEISYNGADGLTITMEKACTGTTVERRITLYNASQVRAVVRDNLKSAYADMPSSVTDEGVVSAVTDCDKTFSGCTNLVAAPQISSSATSLTKCFSGCTSLVTAPPSFPSNAEDTTEMFSLCPNLEGNITFDGCSQLQTADRMFEGTEKDIFILNNGSSADAVKLKNIAQSYVNVHYEIDDNPAPVVSNFTLTRVSGVGETDFVPSGLYVYIQARFMVYDTLIPDGWTNELKGTILKDNGTTETVTWQPPITGYPADIYCWIYLGDTSTHTISLQISDSIKDEGVEVKSQSSAEMSKILSKSYALVDYYHDDVTDTEGMSIGKYAEQADLFDVDMPTLFRQSVTSQDWAGFIQLFAGSTPPTGWLICDGSEVAVADYPLLYAVIGDTYGTPSDSDHFRLPDFMGRTPVGAGQGAGLSNRTRGQKVGAETHKLTVNEMPRHRHKQVDTPWFQSNRVMSSGAYTLADVKTSNVYTEYTGGDQEHNNMQPSLGINFIICTGEIS